jgi:Rrf2 family protein
MQISRSADYAVRILLELASHGSRSNTATIGRRQLVPATLTRRITRQLVAAGWVGSQRGQDGGVWLARPPQTISLLEIIELIDGPIWLNRCLVRAGECPFDRVCPVHVVWREGLELLRGHLQRATLADLVEQGKALRESLRRKDET